MAKMLLLVAGAVASRNEGTTMLQTGNVAEHRVSSTSRAERLAAMKEQVLSFVQNGVPEGAATHLTEIKNLLTTEVMNTLIAEKTRHEEDQTGALTTPFTKASEKYETTMAPLRDANLTAVNALKTTHWQCRSGESDLVTAYNTCDGELTDATDTFNSAVSAAVASSGDNDLCQASGWSSGTVATLNSYKNAVGKVITDREAMDLKNSECVTAKNDEDAKRGTCDADQLAYEQGACRRSLAISKAASDYDGTYSNHVDAYDNQKNGWTADSDDRIEQCKVVKTIICYVDSLQANDGAADLSAAVSACDGGKDAHDCSEVTFVVGSVPGQAPTDDVPATACQAAFSYSETSPDVWYAGTANPGCTECESPF